MNMLAAHHGRIFGSAFNPNKAIALGLLSSITDAWELTGDRNSAMGGPALGLAAGGTEANFSADGAQFTCMVTTNLTGVASLATDAAIYGVIKVNGAGTNRITIGLANNSSGAQQKWFTAQVGPGGTLIYGAVDDASDADLPSVSGATSPGSSVFFRANLDWAAKTMNLLLDTTDCGDTVAVDMLWATMQYLMIRDSTGDDLSAMSDALKWLQVIVGRQTTPAEDIYLATGKSYANILADAA